MNRKFHIVIAVVAIILAYLVYGWSVSRTVVIFATGQSNMTNKEPFRWDAPRNVYFWNYDATTQTADAIGTKFVRADHKRIGPAVAAAAELVKAHPHWTVYVININRGGLGIVNWGDHPQDYDFRKAITNNLPAALRAIGRDKIDFFVWCGGESDANGQSTTLVPNFDAMADWLATQSWFPRDTLTYIMGFSPWAESSPGDRDYLWNRYNGDLRKLVYEKPDQRRYISIEDFSRDLFKGPNGIAGDIPYIHRTGQGYYVSGQRLGQAFLADLK